MKATEQYFPVVLFILLQKVTLKTVCGWNLGVSTQMKVTVLYFPVVLLLLLFFFFSSMFCTLGSSVTAPLHTLSGSSVFATLFSGFLHSSLVLISLVLM